MAVPSVCRLLAAALLAISAASLVSGTPCPPEWWQSGGWCYKTSQSRPLSWAGAADLCQEHGGALVTIKDRNKLLDVVDLLKGLEPPRPPPPTPPPPPPETPRRTPSPESLTRFGRSVGRLERLLMLRRLGRSPSGDSSVAGEAGSRPNVVGAEKRWWINIQKTTGSTGIAARDDDVYDNFGEEKIIKNASSGESGTHLCVYMTAADGLWYWTPCDTALHFVCQKEADRVPVVVVSPEHSRPDPTWLRDHEATLAATLPITISNDDDKGEYSASKATMTPIPPTTTTPAAVTVPGGGVPVGPVTTTASPCSGQGWWLLGSKCQHLFLDANSWSDAKQFCRAKGGHLTQFDNEAAQTTFRGQYNFNTGSIWIGLSSATGSAPYRWVADATQPGFSAWAPGQPISSTDGATNCVALDLSTNKWLVTNCSEPKTFSCSRAVDAVEPPPTVATTTAPTVAAPCGGDGWWAFGTTCLLLVSDQPVSWHAAELACRNISATQVKIQSFELNANIRGKLNSVSAWIGLSKWNPAGTYQWTDGSAIGYNHWAGRSGSSADTGSCAQLDGTNGYWRAINCNAPQPYVCQRPMSGGAPQLPPPPRPPPRSSCPPSWQLYGADRCLKLLPQPTSWQDARQACQDLADGGDLLSVPSAVHQAFLASAVRESPDRLWISLTYGDLDRRRFLTWTDESPVNYTNWAPGQPSNPCASCPKTCAVVDGRRSGTPVAWEDVDCSIAHGAVCQRPATPNNSIAVTQTFCDNTNSQYIAAADSCYKIIHDEMTWHDAVDSCQNDGSALAYIGDLFDNAELVKLLYRDGRDLYWLGLSDTARHGIMEWSKPWPTAATFLNWDPAFPRTPQRDSCAAFVAATGLWQQRACSTERHAFVCQRAPEREAAAPPAGTCSSAGGMSWIAGETRCYRAFEPSGAGLNWTQAKAECERQGYQLATVASVSDFRAIREAVQGLRSQFSAWIGLSSQKNLEYGWTDGSPVGYRAWHRSEPSLASACGQASRLTAGRWQTAACSRDAAYVCMTGMDGAGGTSATITGNIPAAAGSPWATFGVVLLVLAMAVALAGVGLWFARRQHVTWLPGWLQGARGLHRSAENLAYSRQHDTDCTDGAVENGSLNAIAANRWGSQEQLVIREDL